MAPQRNDELRTQIKNRFAQLKTLGARLRSETLRQEFNLPGWKIQYYLREPGVDRRRRFPKHTLQKLSLDDAEALHVAAEDLGVTPSNLKAAALRVQGINAVRTKRQEISHRGYFDWLRVSEAKELSIHPNTISTARLTLRTRFGLYLDKPNLLAHRDSGRVCRLDLREQRALLSDPAGWVVRHAKDIARRWEKTSLDEVLKREG